MLARRYWVPTNVLLLLVICCTNISKAQNITHCTSSCGDIHNISFPFRLETDPQNCGDYRFELECQNNRTVISLESRKYYVREINYDKYLIRAIDPDLRHHQISSNCINLPKYLDMLAPTTSTFLDVGLNIPIVYFNCSAPAKFPRYVETTFCSSQNKTSYSQSHSYVAIGQDMPVSDLAENCSVKMVTWGSAQGLSGDNTSLSSIRASLSYGFDLLGKLPTCAESVMWVSALLRANATVPATF